MSNTALYKNLSGVQLNVSQALVKETVNKLRSLISSRLENSQIHYRSINLELSMVLRDF
ncbi:MAG: hypothetical protein V7L20_21410 [Nostoc sp.]|uniref:hypothetical protein n=1 Tax=Nostoc sp. TaxID=1180 RepID=UPI002FF80C17